MNFSLTEDGFEIHRGVISSDEIELLRSEAHKLIVENNSTCVRHITKKSEVFSELSQHSKLLNLLPGNLSPVRSILFNKTLKENWPVAWHQDLTISVKEKRENEGYGTWTHKDGSPHVHPPIQLLENMATARIHLDETTKLNGALRVIPKSHSKGKIDSGNIRKFTEQEDHICECMPGDVLLMSPLILHSSKRSEIPSNRRILHFEYAHLSDLDHRLEWFENNSRITKPIKQIPRY